MSELEQRMFEVKRLFKEARDKAFTANQAYNRLEAKTNELKPCPFCGGEAEVRMFTATLIFVQCKSCLAGTSGFNSEHEAVKVWNRRWTFSEKFKKVMREWLKNFLKN